MQYVIYYLEEQIPLGKLNMTFPQTTGQCPIYYNHYSSGRPSISSNYRFTSRYQDIADEPLYPFGYGLSYSKFEYSNLSLNKTIITSKQTDSINVSVTIKNNSSIPGFEIVQLYIQDLFGTVVRPVKELKDFQKVFFREYEEKTISFLINLEMLKFFNNDLKYIAEPGEFKVYVGKNSVQNLQASFYYKNNCS